MTTHAAPAAWAEWKAKHMKLVTACEDQAIVAFDAQRVGMGTWTAALAKLDAARAALAAHLDQMEPMTMALCERHSLVLRIGEPYVFHPVGDCKRCASMAAAARDAYGHPKESA